MQKISIIIPVYNEARTILELVARVLDVSFPIGREILIIDDCSNDGTDKALEELSRRHAAEKIRIMRNEKNRGKGASVIRGLEAADGDIVVVQDADFEYSPSELPRLIEPILRGEADAVYGSRFQAGYPTGMAFPNYFANVFLTALTNILFGTRLTDMETCYKLLRRDIIASLQLRADRFEFEPEITSKLALTKRRIIEMPISYEGRTAAQGKKIKARDFFIALAVLFKNRFSKLE
ncbi:MAG TPA: glycosyltransferase family 2 protein [Candidatus Omnitrophota bacterium]|nr:MAG: Undecaprenyl-phosphate 4-deoxy-4-formamido-L-arabinose transferase [Chloroflexi bacterium ADurb.Bin344]HOG24462.1 glycosyltransferase family 2 protein [Candidatus Omnitrophota bacterium]